MFPRCVFLFLYFFVGLQECLSQDEKSLELNWHCIKICTGVSGVTEFDFRDNTCKCRLDGTVDEQQKAEMLKDAEEVGVHLILQDGFDSNQFSKREVDAHIQPKEQLVGQRTPKRFTPAGSRSPIYFPSTTRRSILRRTTPRVLIPNQRRTPLRRNADVQHRLDEIQKRISDLRSKARNNAGPHLQLRAGFENSTQPLREKLKEIQKEIHEKRKTKTVPKSTATENPSVGAPAPKPAASTHIPPILRASHNPSPVSEKPSEENHHLEIITQDPSLYKDDHK